MEIKNHTLTPPADIRPTSPNIGGSLVNPTMIVLHYTASGGSSGVDDADYLSRASTRASAHVVVGRDGSVHQIVPFNRKAWHAGKSTWKGKDNCNDYSVGIEIDNWGWLSADGKSHSGVSVPTDQQFKGTRSGHSLWETYKPAQLATVEAVIAALVKAYPSITTIVGHEDIAPGRKQDPGPALDSFKKQMQEKYTMEVVTEKAPTSTESKPQPTKSDTESKTVTATSLRLRDRPSTNGMVLTNVTKGRKVTVLGKDVNGWTKVQVGPRTGYMATEFLG